MEKKALAAHVAAGAGAILLLLLVVLQSTKLAVLQDSMDQLNHKVKSLERITSSVSSDLNHIEDRIARKLEEGASLFTQAETTLSYEDGALFLTATVVPKEIRAGETVTLSVEGCVPVAMEARGAGYTGTLRVSLGEEIKPLVLLYSDDGLRQEILPSLFPTDLLSISFHTMDGQDRPEANLEETDFCILLSPTEAYSREVLAQSRPVLAITGDDGTETTVEMEYRADVSQSFKGGSFVAFVSDLATFHAIEGVRFAAKLSLTTPDGLALADADKNPLTEFYHDANGSGSGSMTGSSTLYPVFPKSR